MTRTESKLTVAHIPPGPKRLMVVVPSAGQTCKKWKPLLDRLQKDVPNADWLLHDHHRGVASTRGLSSMAADLAAAINQAYENHKPYTGVTLIGHSLGGILVRKAYLIGCGQNFGAYSGGKKEWSGKVDRIILFSALNRGFDPERVGIWNYPARAALLLPFFRLARDYMKGSDVMTDLRISWIRHFRDLEKQPVVIQLCGATDQYLESEDSADIDQFSRAKQELMAGVGHSDTYRLPAGQEDERYAFLKHQIMAAEGDAASPHTDKSGQPKDIIFLVHGIRAYNSQWPTRAAEIIRREYPDAIAVPAGYPYFSALNFAIPFMRRRQIRWMQDEYSYRFAKHPGAKFYFLGHSNGTYLLGRTLERVPSVEFVRATLVGSVLPQSFDWKSHIGTRVGEYQNHRAARDIPVGLLCSLLRGFGMRDIGTAGFSGFLPGDTGREVFYYPGGHGAALKNEDSLARLIRYTLTGDKTVEYLAGSANKPGFMSIGSRMMPFVAIPLMLALGTAIVLLAESLAAAVGADFPLSLTGTTVVILSAIAALILFVLKVI